MTRRPVGHGERGSVTIHALWVATMLCVVAIVMAQVSTVVRLKHQVASAADLAALAGSRASLAGHDGCAAARSVAQRNDARLVRCRMDLDVATVTARRRTPSWWGHRWAFEVEARAAPDFYVGDVGQRNPDAGDSLRLPSMH